MNKPVSSLDHDIKLVRAQLHQVKRKRKEASILFTENQANVAERQHFFYQRLHRSKGPKINISPDYTHEMKELSKPDDSCRYVMEAEARVCQALHQVEIGVKQHQLLVRQQQRTEKNLKQRIHKEIRNGECMEESLLQAIKNVAIDMACIIVEKESLTNGKRSSPNQEIPIYFMLLLLPHHASEENIVQDRVANDHAMAERV
eukprot:CAMPEP_0178903988 /NCGR_PEP_ID=MMETSP0786-20121207/5456_1 /TAXON_ID=186022 /ORGANISM="Thalassionema frauenfeldii, Strain CCMP 1798" /LENGTH=201 /DNA_ID=CAMNT_0020575407 /DNA_START=104 /DNA_END=710 /DNA_ORIENTATION=-